MDERLWYYENKGERLGPLKETEIRALVRNATITYGSLVWTNGLSAWKNVEDTELLPYLSEISPPPLTGAQVKNTFVWMIAFGPIWTSILFWPILVLCAALDSVSLLFVLNLLVAWILYGILAYRDEKILKRAGYDTSQFGGWCWFVPVYLFKRSKYLGQSYASFIVFIVLWLILPELY